MREEKGTPSRASSEKDSERGGTGGAFQYPGGRKYHQNPLKNRVETGKKIEENGGFPSKLGKKGKRKHKIERICPYSPIKRVNNCGHPINKYK